MNFGIICLFMQKCPSPGFGWVARMSSQPSLRHLPGVAPERLSRVVRRAHPPCCLCLSSGFSHHVTGRTASTSPEASGLSSDAFYCSVGVNRTIHYYFCLNGRLPLKNIPITRSHPLCLRWNSRLGGKVAVRVSVGLWSQWLPFLWLLLDVLFVPVFKQLDEDPVV